MENDKNTAANFSFVFYSLKSVVYNWCFFVFIKEITIFAEIFGKPE